MYDRSAATTTIDATNDPTILVLHPFCPFCTLERVSGDEKASLEILNILIRLYSSSEIRRVSPDCETFLDTMKKEATLLAESLLRNGTVDTTFLKDKLTKRLVEDVMPQHGYVAHTGVETTSNNSNNTNAIEVGKNKTLGQIQTLLPTFKSDAARRIIQQEIQLWKQHVPPQNTTTTVPHNQANVAPFSTPDVPGVSEGDDIVNTIDQFKRAVHLSAIAKLCAKLNQYTQCGRLHCIVIEIHGGVPTIIEAIHKLYDPAPRGPSNYLRTLHYSGLRATTSTNDEYAEATMHAMRVLSTIAYNVRDALKEMLAGSPAKMSELQAAATQAGTSVPSVLT